MSSSTFQVPRWYWIALTGAGLSTNFMMAFHPSLLPYEYMGPFEWLFRYLAQDMNSLCRLLFYVIFVVHIMEGFYALILARRMNASLTDQILWYVQTTILGVSSMNLIKSKARKHKNSKKRD